MKKALQIPDEHVQHIGSRGSPTTMYKYYVQTLTFEEEKYRKQTDDFFSGVPDTDRSSPP